MELTLQRPPLPPGKLKVHRKREAPLEVFLVTGRLTSSMVNILLLSFLEDFESRAGCVGNMNRTYPSILLDLDVVW
jgi:hypothetical protein